MLIPVSGRKREIRGHTLLDRLRSAEIRKAVPVAVKI
jgi:hypothetical protein